MIELILLAFFLTGIGSLFFLEQHANKIIMGSSIIIAFTLWLSGSHFLTIIFQVFIYFILHFILYIFLNIIQSKKTLLENNILQCRSRLDGLQKTHDVLQNESHSLTQTLKHKESLYEGLKGINQTLEFKIMLQEFSDLLTRLTKFEQGWLVISSDRKIDSIYQLSRNSPPFITSLEEMKPYEKRFKEALSRSETTFIDSSQKEKSFLSIPLLQKNKIVGVLLLTGCDYKELEDIELLSIQLAMQIQKSHLYQKVKTLSIIDGLTQTYLRRHSLNLIRNELKRLEKLESICSILMIDIDNFKQINDEYGHLAGDLLLRDLSKIIQQNLRQIDIMGRYGGEEFLVALPEASKREAFEISERFRKDIVQREFQIYSKTIRLSVSTGIATYPEDSKDLDTLIQQADKVLYQAKKSGRNKVIAYSKQTLS